MARTESKGADPLQTQQIREIEPFSCRKDIYEYTGNSYLMLDWLGSYFST